MANDFLSNLRMAGIFNGPTPFGMPDLSAGQADPSLMRGLFSRLDDVNSFKRGLINRQITDEMNQRFRSEDMLKHPGSYPWMPQQGGQLDAVAAAIANPGQVQPGLNYRVDPSASSNANPIDVFKGYTPMDEQKLALQNRALQQKEEQAAATQDINRQKVGISQQRANIYDFKAKNPGMKYITPKGGNVIAVNPITGEQIDTGIDSGTMTEREKMDLQNENVTGQIEKRGEIQKDIQGQRNEGNLAGIAARIEGQKEINAAKAGKEELPSQTRVKVANKAREIINTRPDLAPFITTDSQGNFQVEPPGKSFWGSPTGPSQQQYDTIKSIIYGEEGAPSSTKPAPTKPAAKPAAKSNSKYKVSVED